MFETVFAQSDAAGVVARLKAAGTPGAQKLLDLIAKASPTSLALALRQMAMGGGLCFAQAMRVEFRIVTRICQGHDFYEGVRAALVDRDNRPQWGPAPTAAELDAYFAPLGADDLILEGDAG